MSTNRVNYLAVNDDNNSPNRSDTDKQYILVVLLLTFVLPILGLFLEHLTSNVSLTFALFCKWFIFSAVGLRLFSAGVRQVITPEFTARQIFHIYNRDSLPIVRELGFANLCFGLVGLISLFKPEWRMVSAFASGFFYGIAGVQHLIKSPVGTNEKFALWTDLVIFIILALYFIETI